MGLRQLWTLEPERAFWSRIGGRYPWPASSEKTLLGGVSIPVGYAGPAAEEQTVHGTRLTLTNLGGWSAPESLGRQALEGACYKAQCIRMYNAINAKKWKLHAYSVELPGLHNFLLERT